MRARLETRGHNQWGKRACVCVTSEREHSTPTGRYTSGTLAEAGTGDRDLEAGHKDVTIDTVGTDNLKERAEGHDTES